MLHLIDRTLKPQAWLLILFPRNLMTQPMWVTLESYLFSCLHPPCMPLQLWDTEKDWVLLVWVFTSLGIQMYFMWRGPGFFDQHQGSHSPSPFWFKSCSLVNNFSHDCQGYLHKHMFTLLEGKHCFSGYVCEYQPHSGWLNQIGSKLKGRPSAKVVDLPPDFSSTPSLLVSAWAPRAGALTLPLFVMHLVLLFWSRCVSGNDPPVCGSPLSLWAPDFNEGLGFSSI